MKKIAYIVPYFGRLPKSFRFWLLGCKTNPTVDFLLFTDDKTEYDYPENVRVSYLSFDEMKKRFQDNFDFQISLERPYKLCDFRPAYGELFSRELEKYDFWGYCDIDMIFGNIRAFYTDELLDRYDRIGCQGHSTLFRNTEEVNSRYRTETENYSYKTVFTSDRGFAFDELGMNDIYNSLGMDYYKKVCFVHLTKFDTYFRMALLPEKEDYKNTNQIFTWKKGRLLRHYVYNNQLFEEEYMYLHYWLRPTSFKIKNYDANRQYVIYPDVTRDDESVIHTAYVMARSRQSKLTFYLKSLWKYIKKITPKRIMSNIIGVIYNKKNH